MRLPRILAISIMIISVVFSISTPVNAALIVSDTTRWLITDQDGTLLQIQTLATGWEFGIYNPGSPPVTLSLLDHSQLLAVISYDASNNIYVEEGLNQYSTLDVGGTGEYGIFYKNTATPELFFNFTASKLSEDIYLFYPPGSYSPSSGGQILGDDMQPTSPLVPIPSAVIILGSGLVAFVGIRRKFKI